MSGHIPAQDGVPAQQQETWNQEQGSPDVTPSRTQVLPPVGYAGPGGGQQVAQVPPLQADLQQAAEELAAELGGGQPPPG